MLRKFTFSLLIAFSTILPQSKSEKIDQLVKAYNANRVFSGAVLVAEKGRVIYSKGIGMANMEWDIPNTTDTKFRLGSITKQFTAAVIMQLVEQNKLKLENKITEILPDYPAKTGDRITIHHLLTHTGGVPNYTDFPEFFKNNARKNMNVQELLDLFKDKELDFEPGSKWKYSNSGYLVLGAIIEKVTGKTYEEVVKENIFDIIGMKDSGYDHFQEVIKKRATGYDRTPDGYRNSDFLDMSIPYAAGSLFSTVEDLYKWDQALYTNKILSEESKQKAFTGYISAFGNTKYGYGWMITYTKTGENDSTIVIQHGGGIFGFNTMIMRQIENNNCIVLLNNTPGANLSDMGTKISSILYGLPYEMPKKSASDQFYVDYKKSGIEKAIENYKEAKKAGNNDIDFNPAALNNLGYNFLGEKKIKEAVAVFKLNMDLNPDDANAYDSYAEGLLASGDTANSIINYKKSLELNPQNFHAVAVLKDLKQDVGGMETISPELLKTYTGKYELASNFIIVVTVEGDRLFVQATGQDRFEVFPETSSRFFLKVVDAKIDFVKEGDKVTHMILHQGGKDANCKKIE